MNITYFVKDVVATHPGVLLADLSMLPTQDLGVEITIVLSGDGAGIGLSADLDTPVILCFTKESELRYRGIRLTVFVAAIVVVVALVGV